MAKYGEGDNWGEWKAHVLKKLDDLQERQIQMHADISALKVKAGIWGVLGGLIPSVIAIGVILIRSM